MSFAEILEKAYLDAAEISAIQKSTKQITAETKPSANINTPEIKEVKTEVKTDTPGYITIGDAIMQSAKIGLLNSKKLRTTNKCKRIAKHFVSGQCKPEHLIKAKNHIMRNNNPKHGDFKLCGGWGTLLLFSYLDNGMDINQALNQEFKGNKDET